MTFLLLCPRSGQAVLDLEFEDFLRVSGLDASELEQRALDSADARIGDTAGFEGIFIGGSPFTITDPEDLHWQDTISRALVDLICEQERRGEAGIPVFATCYGTSMLAHYCGGVVTQEFAETAGPSEVVLTEAAAQDPIMAGMPQRFTALTGHKDSVTRLPEGATLLASGPTCPTQIYRFGAHTWVTQFHPEMDVDAMANRLRHYLTHGYAEPDDYAVVVAAAAGHDTTAAASLIRRFVRWCREEGAGQVPAVASPGRPCPTASRP